MKRKILLLFISFVIILCSQYVVPLSGKELINPFDLLENLTKESELLDVLGEGLPIIEYSGEQIIKKKQVYYCPINNLWVDINLSHVLDQNLERFVTGITFTKKKLCSMDLRSQKQFASLRTPKGAKIGDSIEKIIEIYGKPSIIISIENEKKFSLIIENYDFKTGVVLRYLPKQKDETLFYEFYFSNKRLHTILFSYE